MFLISLPQEFQANFLVQFLLFSFPGYILLTLQVSTLFFAYNSQLSISRSDLLQASETQPIQNLHSVFPCQSPLSLRISVRSPDVADSWLVLHLQIYALIFLCTWPPGKKLHLTVSLAAECAQVTVSNSFLTCSEGHCLSWTSYLSSFAMGGKSAHI